MENKSRTQGFKQYFPILDQNERDHAALVAAVRSRKIEAQME
jgi:hypothetical protein